MKDVDISEIDPHWVERLMQEEHERIQMLVYDVFVNYGYLIDKK